MSDINEQIEPRVEPAVSSGPGRNPFNVSLALPEKITVRMVDASVLSDYEVWIFVASLAFGAAAGFITPTVQEWRSESALAVPFTVMLVLLTILFVIFFATALTKRRLLNVKGREIVLTTSDVELPK